MKVISQLVRHFWQTGALSPDDVEYLLRHGFARQRDFPGYRRAKSSRAVLVPADREPVPVAEPTHYDIIEEALRQRGPNRRGRAGPSAQDVPLEMICRRLRAIFKRRSSQLVDVLDLARSVGKANDWEQALVTMHTVEPQRLAQSLVRMLKRDEVQLEDLWHALDPCAFVELSKEPTWKGNAASAFSALVVTSDPMSLGKYKWILKYPEMCTLGNLLRVWKRFLSILGSTHKHDRSVITRALKGVSDPAIVWSFVLLYNATHYNDPRTGRREYGPLTLPSNAVWSTAWTCALLMDRTVMSPYLAACYSVQSPDADPTVTCQCPVMCPSGWRVPC
jgi:hypothetical protein